MNYLYLIKTKTNKNQSKRSKVPYLICNENVHLLINLPNFNKMITWHITWLKKYVSSFIIWENFSLMKQNSKRYCCPIIILPYIPDPGLKSNGKNKNKKTLHDFISLFHLRTYQERRKTWLVVFLKEPPRLKSQPVARTGWCFHKSASMEAPVPC